MDSWGTLLVLGVGLIAYLIFLMAKVIDHMSLKLNSAVSELNEIKGMMSVIDRNQYRASQDSEKAQHTLQEIKDTLRSIEQK
jgi:hypothetical protein